MRMADMGDMTEGDMTGAVMTGMAVVTGDVRKNGRVLI
jgi:hypothetical protein